MHDGLVAPEAYFVILHSIHCGLAPKASVARDLLAWEVEEVANHVAKAQCPKACSMSSETVPTFVPTVVHSVSSVSSTVA